MPLVRYGAGRRVYTFPAGLLGAADIHFRDPVTNTTRLPAMDGGFDTYGDGAAPQAVGSLSVNFALVSADGMDMDAQRDAVLSLQGWRKQPLWFQPTDGGAPERFCWAKVSNISLTQKENDLSDYQQAVSINFQVSDPHWYVNRYEAPLWGAFDWGDGSLWGGAAALQAASGLSTTLVNAENIGNADALPRITLYVGAGQQVTYPRIQRIVNAHVVQELGWNGTLTAGDVLELNCRGASVKLNQADAYANLEFDSADWLTLLPGDNTLRLVMAGAGDACSVAVRWFDTYF